VEIADAIIRSIEDSVDLTALKAAWKESGMATPAGYERLHPEDRKRCSTAYKRRERQISKPARELDAKLADATSTEDL
jgi:hypothetical protein